ncbi:MAG: glycosyltransferase family 10, partial [Betaproteobacteria bacterium]
MSLRQIRVAHYGFWAGFQVADLALRLPALSRKYELVADQARPELVVFSVFPDKTMPRVPDRGVPTLFLTGENVVPDMARCDFAISFQRDIDDARHMRIPNWVQRFNWQGISPAALLSARRPRGATPAHFCAYVHNNRVALREEFVRALARHAAVDCPGVSMNNLPAIGAHPSAKIDFLRDRRFSVAFENAVAPGYTTEKLPEALLAGCVPIYAGDPLVGLDFNP